MIKILFIIAFFAFILYLLRENYKEKRGLSVFSPYEKCRLFKIIGKENWQYFIETENQHDYLKEILSYQYPEFEYNSDDNLERLIYRLDQYVNKGKIIKEEPYSGKIGVDYRVSNGLKDLREILNKEDYRDEIRKNLDNAKKANEKTMEILNNIKEKRKKNCKSKNNK